jgi:hypothetical protein
MGPEHLAAKTGDYARRHAYIPTPPLGRRRPAFGQESPQEEWRRPYPLFPRLLFVLGGTGPAGIDTRISALHAAARSQTPVAFRHEVPVLAAPLTELLRDGPAAPVWHHVLDPGRRVGWNQTWWIVTGGLRSAPPTRTPDHKPDHDRPGPRPRARPPAGQSGQSPHLCDDLACSHLA